jgi:hypothetical protein
VVYWLAQARLAGTALVARLALKSRKSQRLTLVSLHNTNGCFTINSKPFAMGSMLSKLAIHTSRDYAAVLTELSKLQSVTFVRAARVVAR